MSLTDLKRKKKKVQQTKISVEDFIEDANNYALGKPSVLEAKPARPKGLDKSTTKIFRHATFTLTEQSIAQLNALSKETNIAKSRLLRIFIQEFCNKSKHEQTELLENSHSDSVN